MQISRYTVYFKIHESYFLVQRSLVNYRRLNRIYFVLSARAMADINYIYDSFIDKRSPASAKGIVVHSHGRFEKQTHRMSRQIKISSVGGPSFARPCNELFSAPTTWPFI